MPNGMIGGKSELKCIPNGPLRIVFPFDVQNSRELEDVSDHQSKPPPPQNEEDSMMNSASGWVPWTVLLFNWRSL